MMKPLLHIKVIALLLSAALLASACNREVDDPQSGADSDADSANVEDDVAQDAEAEDEATGTEAAATESADVEVISLALRPSLFHAPILVALERGYFEEAGVELEITEFGGSSGELMAVIARGDIDMMPTSARPSLLNASELGFELEFISSYNEPRVDWANSAWLVVRQDVWDEGTVRDPGDVAGLTMDIAGEGSPLHLITLLALEQGGIDESEVELTERSRTPPDMLASLENARVDVQAVIEPMAASIEQQGVGTRWLGFSDVAPGWQGAYILTSEGFSNERPEAAKGFLVALLRGIRDVIADGGEWDPEVRRIVAEGTNVEEGVLDLTGVPYASPNGDINRDWIQQEQEVWLEQGLVDSPIDIEELINEEPLERALEELGRE